MISTLLAEWVFPVAGPPIPDGVVIVEGSRIVDVLPRTNRRVDLILDGFAIVPGLVNAHTHLDLTGAAGRTPPDPHAPFPDWLRRVIDYRRSCSASQILRDYANGLEQSWRAGVTLLADITAGVPDPEQDIGGQSVPNALPFRELIGLTHQRAEQAALAAEQWLSRPGLVPQYSGLSPHAPYSVRQSLLATAGQLCRRQHHPLAIHIAESPEEMELLECRRGPMVPFLTDLGVFDPDGLVPSVEAAIELVDVGQPKLYIHGNQLSPTTSFPPNSALVYCPRTHAAFWPNHTHPFREFLDAGCLVAMGTDSLASNPDLDLLAEARFVAQRYPELPGATLLAMITLNGAKALGLEDAYGVLAPSSLANLVAVPIPKRPDCSDPHELLFRDTKIGERLVMLHGRWRNVTHGPRG